MTSSNAQAVAWRQWAVELLEARGVSLPDRAPAGELRRALATVLDRAESTAWELRLVRSEVASGLQRVLNEIGVTDD